jgi:co-chaperonin GroES (HSP10)
MADDKKAVLFYCDLIHTIEKLILKDRINKTNNAGELFYHYAQYINDLNPIPINDIVDLAFEPIKQTLKRDLKKWVNIKIKRSEAGKSGGINSGKSRSKKQNEANEANASKTKQNEANEAVSVSVSVSDSVSVSKINTKVFIAPTPEDVIKYFKENGYDENLASRAFKYYDTANWKDSKGKQVKNWKQKMQGVWFKEENKTKQTSLNEPLKMVY